MVCEEDGSAAVRREDRGKAGVDEGNPLFLRLVTKHNLPLQFRELGLRGPAVSIDPRGQKPAHHEHRDLDREPSRLDRWRRVRHKELSQESATNGKKRNDPGWQTSAQQ